MASNHNAISSAPRKWFTQPAKATLSTMVFTCLFMFLAHDLKISDLLQLEEKYVAQRRARWVMQLINPQVSIFQSRDQLIFLPFNEMQVKLQHLLEDMLFMRDYQPLGAAKFPHW